MDLNRRRRWWLLRGLLSWVWAGIAMAWYHWWTAPGTTTVTGAIVYWMSYMGVALLLWVALLAVLFYVGRAIFEATALMLYRSTAAMRGLNVTCTLMASRSCRRVNANKGR